MTNIELPETLPLKRFIVKISKPWATGWLRTGPTSESLCIIIVDCHKCNKIDGHTRLWSFGKRVERETETVISALLMPPPLSRALCTWSPDWPTQLRLPEGIFSDSNAAQCAGRSHPFKAPANCLITAIMAPTERSESRYTLNSPVAYSHPEL